MLFLLPVVGQTTMVDLTTRGTGNTLNDAWFLEASMAPTKFSVYDPFVRIEKEGADQMQGYNTDGRINPGEVAPFDDNEDKRYTHSLLLTSVPRSRFGDVTYLEFMFDIKQTGNNQLLSLDKLQLYQGIADRLKNFTGEEFSDLGTPIWDLDLGTDGDNMILLDYLLSEHNGKGDMFAYIPIAALKTGDYLLLYSQFKGVGANDSNEDIHNDLVGEWAVGMATQVPEPTTLLLLGLGLVGLVGARKKFQK